MNKKSKNIDNSDKILSQNIIYLQELNKDMEKEFYSKESISINQKLLLEIIFNLLNSQVTLLFQLSKINSSISKKKINNSHLVDHILSFNKDLMSKHIQKIISFINDYKNPKQNNINKKKLNSSFLIRSSYKIPNKNKIYLKNNNTLIIDNNLSKDYFENCKTEQNECIDFEKNIIHHSLKDNDNIDRNKCNKKSMKTNDTDNCRLNSKLINYIKCSNNTNPTNLKKIIKRGQSSMEINISKKEVIESLNDYSNYNTSKEENPVRKVKNIIINAKRNSSVKKERNRKKEDLDIINISNNYEKILHNKILNKKRDNFHKQNPTDVSDLEYKNIYNEIEPSLKDNDINTKNNNTINDKNISFYDNSSNKKTKNNRESIQLLHIGMKNIKNKLIYNKLHKKE